MDTQGLAVPGATITVTGPQGAKNFVTDAEGGFSAPILVPGVYTVRAELQGFKAAEVQDVTVRLGQTSGLEVKMEVGGLSETVEVTGAAAAVDVRSTTTGANLSSETANAFLLFGVELLRFRVPHAERPESKALRIDQRHRRMMIDSAIS